MTSTHHLIIFVVLICLVAVQTKAEIEPDLPIAVQKCKDYSRHVYTNIHTATESKNVDRCGHKADPLISGCTTGVSREFPHAALIGYKLNENIFWSCSGSLVSTRYVLTAGHCIKELNMEILYVRLGELVLNDETDDATKIDIPVERIIKHPEYTNNSRYNDLGLLKLAFKVILSSYILPICLPTTNLEPDKLIDSVWGRLYFGSDKSDALLKFVLEHFNNTECNEIYQYNQSRKLRRGIIEKQICAGSRNDSIGCGDGGSPLQIYHPDTYCMYIQVGIASFGIGCGMINLPDVYTRVFSYVPWIESVIWAPGEDD